MTRKPRIIGNVKGEFKLTTAVTMMFIHFKNRDVYDVTIAEVMAEAVRCADSYCKQTSEVLGEFLNLIKKV